MNHYEAPSDDAEVMRIFQENKSLGADTNIWLRAFRHVFQGGESHSLISFVVPTGADRSMPLAIIAMTKKNRLVLWPALPRQQCCFVDKPNHPLVDHATIEFPSEKIHFTSYGAGSTTRVSDGWRSNEFSPGFHLLLMMFVQRTAVAEQDVLMSRTVGMPDSDKLRRLEEYSRIQSHMQVMELDLPFTESQSQYIGMSLFRTDRLITDSSELPSLVLPAAREIGNIEGWPNDSIFPMCVRSFELRDKFFCLAAGYPPGKLNDVIAFGLPTRQQKKIRSGNSATLQT